MFDRVVVQPTKRVHETRDVTVTEQRAPTDESVRLLREMETVARDQIVEAMIVRDTALEATIHRMHDLASHRDIFRAVFSLNGVKLQACVYRDMGDYRSPWLTDLRDEIAKVIANEVLKSAPWQMQGL